MDKCHILLGRLWQRDVDATHKGNENIYMFPWKGQRVALKPNPPISKSIKENETKLISICNQSRSRFWDQTFPQAEFAKDGNVQDLIDWNWRMSSFEEGGTNEEIKIGSGQNRAKVNKLSTSQAAVDS